VLGIISYPDIVTQITFSYLNCELLETFVQFYTGGTRADETE